MRIVTIAGSAVLILSAFGANAALAQSTPSDWGSVPCSQFTSMDASGQASIASQIKPSDVAKSMTSNSGSGSTMDTTTTDATSASAQGTISPGALVAACQATPSMTLHDVVSTPGAVPVPAGQ